MCATAARSRPPRPRGNEQGLRFNGGSRLGRPRRARFDPLFPLRRTHGASGLFLAVSPSGRSRRRTCAAQDATMRHGTIDESPGRLAEAGRRSSAAPLWAPTGEPTVHPRPAYRSQAEALSVADERRQDNGVDLNVYRMRLLLRLAHGQLRASTAERDADRPRIGSASRRLDPDDRSLPRVQFDWSEASYEVLVGAAHAGRGAFGEVLATSDPSQARRARPLVGQPLRLAHGGRAAVRDRTSVDDQLGSFVRSTSSGTRTWWPVSAPTTPSHRSSD